MRNMRRILGIKWSDRITNNEVLERAGIPSMYTLLCQRRLRWLGHVLRMQDSRIHKDLLFGGHRRAQGRPHLRYKDVSKCIDVKGWEGLAEDRLQWRQALSRGLHRAEENIRLASDEKRTKRKNSQHH